MSPASTGSTESKASYEIQALLDHRLNTFFKELPTESSGKYLKSLELSHFNLSRVFYIECMLERMLEQLEQRF